MILACTKHVKEALKTMYLPHVQVISNGEKANECVRCHVCGHKAQYKLFNYLHQKKQNLSNAI